MCHGQVKRPLGDAYLNTCHNLFFLGRIQTPVFSDQPIFFLRVYVSRAVEQAFRRCLFEYMYNPPRVILDSRLQGTAHESEEIELQGVMIWFLINSRVRVMISDSWSFLRWWHQRILCEKDTCCSLCSWLFWMCVTCKSRSVKFYILARQIFRKVILLDENRLLTRWPKSAKVLRKMFNGVENLIKNWDDFNAEFKESATLRDKTMLIPMMYLSWELCDDTYLKWDKLNPMAWPDPSTLRCGTTWTRCAYMYVFVFVYCNMHTY